MRVKIKWTQEIGPLEPFWQSTGFTPAELLLTGDMQQALTWYGSIPHQGILHVRIHFLLELVRVKPGPYGELEYDWGLLDIGLSHLLKNSLKPIFEIMGNPSGYFNDFNDPRQLRQWKALVRELARHLAECFGREEVESWYFESWNEPDAGWWPQWPHDERSFCNYYDATSEGLREANPRLRFGGPGTCRTLSSLFRTFLAHCDSGTNALTGEKGVRLDFISIHEKGAVSTPEEINPDTGALWRREAHIIEYIRANHPCLAGLPFMNNECDPQVGWWHTHTWHGRPYYATLACKMIQQHLVGLIDGLHAPYALLSNDNGFIGGWGNRTLLARFGQAGLIESGQSSHKPRILTEDGPLSLPPFDLVKKPVLNAWEMLALLGDTRLAVDPPGEADAPLGVIATRRGSEQAAVLVYHSVDRIAASGCEPVSLRIEGLPFSEAALAHYRIDEDHTNPFALWETPPTPDRPASERPSPELLSAMRARQELELLEQPRIVKTNGGAIDLDFSLPLPGLSLVLLSRKPAEPPGQVQGVNIQVGEGLHGQKQLLVHWMGLPLRTIQTFEVLLGASPDGPLERINPTDLLCTAYLHPIRAVDPAEVYIRVRAVDYWGRSGAASEAILVNT